MSSSPPEVPKGPLAANQRTPFVGRDAERGTLLDLVEEASGGHGSLTFIAGEPGVGKTRLVEEVGIDASARGLLVLLGHCYESAGGQPFLPFVEMLEGALQILPRETFREVLADVLLRPRLAKEDECNTILGPQPEPVHPAPDELRVLLGKAKPSTPKPGVDGRFPLC